MLEKTRSGDLDTQVAEEVCICLQRRMDGGLRVYSDDVPGLILSGSNPAYVMADVWPALVVLLKIDG